MMNLIEHQSTAGWLLSIAGGDYRSPASYAVQLAVTNQIQSNSGGGS